MALRDHFHPPFTDAASWEEFHGQWPAVIVQQLRTILPPGYVAGPKVHAGQVKIDVAAYERSDVPVPSVAGKVVGGLATAAWVAPPVVRVETELPDYDKYEVRVYDARRGRVLVAAIEIVNPANKDRPVARNAFVAKCAVLLRNGVAVSIIDVVTSRQFNLYAELMSFVGHPDPTMSVDPPHLYAATCRWVRREPRALLEAWSHALAVGQSLPKLPLWLADALVHLHLIFSPLKRITRGTPQPQDSGSLGLGLYIANEIVKGHGGRIDVESSEARGTTFTVHLPRHHPTA